MLRIYMYQRNVFKKHPEESKLWGKVDERLKSVRKKCTTPEELARYASLLVPSAYLKRRFLTWFNTARLG